MWRGSSLPKEKIIVIRPLTPRKVAGCGIQAFAKWRKRVAT
jgi:hypothetical protein